MKVFFYMGRNPHNISGVSWKLWKIHRSGRVVTTSWGPAIVRGRRVVPATGRLQSRKRTFPTVGAAENFEAARIRSKEVKGYERKPRAKP